MALRDIVIEKDSVTYNGALIPLRGINPEDIKNILVKNRNSVNLLFDMAERKGVKSAQDLTEDRLKLIASTAITELPVLIANIIAQCADDIESAEIVEKLPISTQFDCLRKIARLTFSDATNFGQFLGNVAAAVEAMNSLSPEKRSNGARLPNAGTQA